jgi:hypothetical protein
MFGLLDGYFLCVNEAWGMEKFTSSWSYGSTKLDKWKGKIQGWGRQHLLFVYLRSLGLFCGHSDTVLTRY